MFAKHSEPLDRKADPDVSVRHVFFGAGAIAAMIAVSLIAAWRLIIGWGGTVHDPSMRLPPFPQPTLEAHPLSDRAAYEAQQARERQRSASTASEAGPTRLPQQRGSAQ